MKPNKLFYIGLIIVSVVLLLAIFAPWISPFNPNDISLPDRFIGPNWHNLMGRDQNGADVFSKILFGARTSLMVSICVVFISTIIGVFMGSLAGYYGGTIDQLIMRFIDMLYAFPGFLLAITCVAVLGPSLKNLIFALCLTGWTGYARLIRGEVLHLKEREYVQSAQALGAKTSRILFQHILPNTLGPLVVQASFGMAATIIAESSLSFLGLGIPPTQNSWGMLLSSGKPFIVEAPHISLFPGIAILLLVISFNFIGDGMRDKLQPRKY